jgi:integral membrane protein (TIGR01906 family)
MHKLFSRMIQWAIALALPVMLFTTNLRLATTHWFVHWEYGKTGFQPDPYGLSTEDRIRLAEICVDYLTTGADISLLADLQLPDGGPAFNERELRHMADVQRVFQGMLTAGFVAALVLLAGGIALIVWRRPSPYLPNALVASSLLTLGLLAAVGVYMALNWNAFFTTFHRIFFEGETWLFDFSDTLIRLFPIRFWMDVAGLLVGLLVVEAVLAGLGGWLWSRRS